MGDIDGGAPAPQRPRQTHFTIRISRRLFRLLILFIILAAVAAGAARLLHWHGWGLTAQEAEQRQATELVSRVGHIMLLPAGETPVIATVTDAASLKKTQTFYQDAANGDVLLVYAKAQRAILYRPAANQVINVGPVYFDNTNAAQAGTPTSSSDAAPAQ